MIFVCLLAWLPLFGAYQIERLADMPRAYYITDFLTDKECDHLIALALPQLRRSTVVDESGKSSTRLDDRRTSSGMFITPNPKDKILEGIEQKIETLTQYPRSHGEAIQVLHYGVGGEYQPHYDTFNPLTPGGQAQLARGGQRVITLIMYLHTTPSGGETIFPRAHIAAPPVRRNALLFYNTLPDGATDPFTLHGGAPVLSGEKWIATKWLHEREFH
jgi:prolyl 4-hydroxylase